MLHFALPWRPCRRIGYRIVPPEPDRIVVAIVGLTFPIARQAYDVRRFLEAAVAQELGVESELDVLEHELRELAVQAGADPGLDLAGIDCHARFADGLTRGRRGEGEKKSGDGNRLGKQG